MTTSQDVITALKEQSVRFVDLWFTDIMGAVKSITIPATQLPRVFEHGIHFDGSSIDGFARVAESDMMLRADPETFVVLPWSDAQARTARLICTVHNPQGEPFIGDPRVALKQVLERARDMGFVFKTGVEMEFFLFRIDDRGVPIIAAAPQDPSGYFDMSNEEAQVVRREMLTTLDCLDISVESAHSEIGYGQHEIDFGYDEALATADKIATARVALKIIAQSHRLHCTFMPRPSSDLPGSGMHTHQSLHDAQSDENVFADPEHEYGLSELAQQFLAGQLHHARAMVAVLAPLINSYKRLGKSFEAPTSVSWAHINRAALIRIPTIAPGLEAHTRLELRCPDPAANPYLAMAVMLQAGLNGIQHRMELPPALEETLLTQNRSRMRQVEELPESLGDALEDLEQNDVILGALGPYISDRYISARQQELDDFNRVVTGWEVDRYITRY